MIIGIMSDSHDNLDNIRKAVTLFNERGVSQVLHAGDFVAPFTFRVLKDLNAAFTGIFGNNDGEVYFLNQMFQGRIFIQPHTINLEDKKLVMLHEHFLVDALADSGHYDIIVYGHTHKPVVEKKGKALVINPGECGGWLYGKATVAVLDTVKMDAEIVEL